MMATRRRINAAFLLGVAVLARPGCVSVNGPSGALPPGFWGGDHIQIEVRASLVRVEFDCAHGSINVPILLNDGDFLANGTFTHEKGGPIIPGEEERPQPARYGGRVAGERMSITVILIDEARAIGTFELLRGRNGRVFKCQ
ncbi:MAG: hypothetical protein ACRENP_24945 [Longimicrobiales bacterium]